MSLRSSVFERGARVDSGANVRDDSVRGGSRVQRHARVAYTPPMCRNIQRLRGAEPPATDAEIHDAALQFVRKISGYRTPSVANTGAFETAVGDVAAAVRRLLDGLTPGPTSRAVTPLQRRRAARPASPTSAPDA